TRGEAEGDDRGEAVEGRGPDRERQAEEHRPGAVERVVAAHPRGDAAAVALGDAGEEFDLELEHRQVGAEAETDDAGGDREEAAHAQGAGRGRLAGECWRRGHGYFFFPTGKK